jgi:AmmeMemoRadiSam system protein A
MEISDLEKKAILSLARKEIERSVKGEISIEKPSDMPLLEKKLGAFVTIKKGEELRGCIGTFRQDLPLSKTVCEMAKAAATQDPRFPPVSEEELPNVEIEVSVLTPLSPIKPEEVVLGRDGLKVQKGGFSGVLLPQVPLQWGWDRETFLSQTCLKAGLSPSCWKEEGTRLEKFEAVVFKESDF